MTSVRSRSRHTHARTRGRSVRFGMTTTTRRSGERGGGGGGKERVRSDGRRIVRYDDELIDRLMRLLLTTRGAFFEWNINHDDSCLERNGPGFVNGWMMTDDGQKHTRCDDGWMTQTKRTVPGAGAKKLPVENKGTVAMRDAVRNFSPGDFFGVDVPTQGVGAGSEDER